MSSTSKIVRRGATSIAAALVLGLFGALGCEREAAAPEDERAETAQTREVEAVAAEESDTPERSATASQAGQLDNVEGGHELALEGERVEVTTE